MFARGLTVELPHGLFDEDGVCHRSAVLRSVTGHEELSLAQGQGDSRAVSELLAGVLDRLGEYDRVDPGLAAELTRGDRQALVLHLRADLFGDRVALLVRCPSPACRQVADVDLRISEILPGTAEPRPWLSCDTQSGPAQVREATGADDDLVAAYAGSRAQRVALLWSRLVVLDGRPLAPDQWPTLPTATRHAIALTLADGARSPDLAFVSRCPSCRAGLEFVIDPFALLARELRSNGDRLLAEVHALAFHYHWPEREILDLPRSRRWRYLELIGRELGGRPLLDGGWS
jgi:hypothetical protein